MTCHTYNHVPSDLHILMYNLSWRQNSSVFKRVLKREIRPARLLRSPLNNQFAVCIDLTHCCTTPKYITIHKFLWCRNSNNTGNAALCFSGRASIFILLSTSCIPSRSLMHYNKDKYTMLRKTSGQSVTLAGIRYIKRNLWYLK